MSKILNEKHQIENLKQKSCIKDITNMHTKFLIFYQSDILTYKY